MAVKTYDHQIYQVAHPLMQKLIQQSINVRKFQSIYPVLFDYLKKTREKVTEQLILELKGPVQEYFEYKTVNELAEQLEIILLDRRLVDQALGYIQTGKVYLHDEFLVKNILTKQELTDIFNNLSQDFWDLIITDYAEKITPDENFSAQYIETLKRVLDSRRWYLPNLLPAWNIEELLVDYMAIMLKYDKYKNLKKKFSHQKAGNDTSKSYPTNAETKDCLKKLFLYDQPLLNAKGAFIDFHTDKNGERSSNYFGVNVDLEDRPQSLPAILSEFVWSYASRRIDYYRGGENGSWEEGEYLQQMSKTVNQLTEMLDKLINQNSFLDRYDTIFSALLALLYFDGVFSQMSRQDYKELENLNLLEMFRYLNDQLDLDEITIKNIQIEHEQHERILTSLKPYTIDDLIQKIIKLFECSEEVKLELITESGKKTTHLLFTLKNEKLSYKLSIKGMKTKIETMLGHFFLNEEERILQGKSDNLLGLSAIFTLLFEKIN